MSRISLAVLACAVLPASGLAQPDPFGPLIDEGLRHNLGLESSRLALERAEAAAVGARGLFLPSISLDHRSTRLTGGFNIGDLLNPAHGALNQLLGTSRFPVNLDITLPFRHETRARLAQPLFDLGILAANQAARSTREATRAGLGVDARSLAARIQLTWIDQASAGRVAELYQATVTLVEEGLRVSERLVAAGMATPDAVHRARADRSDALQRLAEAEQQRDAARRSLNDLLGRPLEAPADPVSDSLLLRPIELTLEQAIQSALTRREELDQARWAERTAGAALTAANGSFLPTVVLALDYGFQGSSFRLGTDNDYRALSLVVQWNLIRGGQDAARRQEARLEAERARIGQDHAARQVRLDVTRAFESALVARDALDTAADRLAAARRTYELVRRRYEEGLAPHVELVQARTELTSAGLNDVLTRYAYAARYADLERAAALRDLEPR